MDCRIVEFTLTVNTASKMKNGQNIDASLDDGILILRDDLNFILNEIDNPMLSRAELELTELPASDSNSSVSSNRTERQNQVTRRAVALKRRKQKLPGKAILAYVATSLSALLLFYRQVIFINDVNSNN